MTSGNFLIGNNLSLEAFDQYILPRLEEKGYGIDAKIFVSRPHSQTEGILVSFIGPGNLETILSDTLVEVGEDFEKAQRDGAVRTAGPAQTCLYRFNVSELSHWEREGEESHQVRKGVFETLGIYANTATASTLFSGLAQGYILDAVQRKIERVHEELKELAEKKLSDF